MYGVYRKMIMNVLCISHTFFFMDIHGSREGGIFGLNPGSTVIDRLFSTPFSMDYLELVDRKYC